MNNHHEIPDLGGSFGNEAAEYVARRAEAYCECERHRIGLANYPRIVALHVEGTHLAECERNLVERFARAKAMGDLGQPHRRARYYWAAGIILAVAAFFFSLIAFEPFRLGWAGVLYCVGIAIVTPLAVEEFLEAWKSDKLFKAVVSGFFCAALVGGALLAAVRGDLLAEQVKQQSSPEVVIDNQAPGAPSVPQTENSFYESTRSSLRMLMLLLALAIDLGAGVAIHRALLLSAASGEDAAMILRELGEVRQRLAAVVSEIAALANAPDIFASRFWRDFYRAMLTQTARKAVERVIGLSLCLLLVVGCRSAPRSPRPDLVIAVDLSTSEAVIGHDGKSQFKRSIEAVGRLFASVPAGSKITIIGITENSFARPYILLSARISDDQGYFGERLAAARRAVLRAWEQRAAKLKPNSRGTDILGALLVASDLFRNSPPSSNKLLYIYSDMRHVTRELNLETPRTLRIDPIIQAVQARSLVAELSGVTVYILGANAEEKHAIVQWNALKQFWTAYFMKSGARLAEYSIDFEPPIP